MSAGIRSRRATLADLDAIAAIEADVFRGDAWSRELVREELAGPHRHYLALENDSQEIVGYAGLLAVGRDGDIQTIALKPSVRGAGHGRRLLRELIAIATERGVRQIFLEVRADNPVARGLYADEGFDEVGIRPRYYQPDGVDAIVMRHTVRGSK